MRGSITILLPAYNEAKAIGGVIQDIRALNLGYEILVVDNKSTNGTKAEAIVLGAKVLYEGKKGKGNAIRAGLKHIKTRFVVMIDADGTYPVASIPLFCDYLEEYDVVKGDRCWISANAMTKTHRFGNWGLSWLASILYGNRVRDVCSGLWAMKMDKVRDFNLVSTKFTLEADLFINTVRMGCRFKELPIEYQARVGGDRAKLAFMDGIKIGWFLIRKRFGK